MKFALLSCLVSLLLLASSLSVPIEIPLQRRSSIAANGQLEQLLARVADSYDQQNVVQMPKKSKCPFRGLLSANGEKAVGSGELPISDFADTFLHGEIAYGTPPQKFNVILDSTMFVKFGLPLNFLIDSKTCKFGKNLPCEKMQLFETSNSTTFSRLPTIKGFSLAKDVIRMGDAQAEGHFLLLNGAKFVGKNSFDVIYKSGALNLPRLDGIFSLAFTSSLMPIKSGMEYLLTKQESKIATVYIQPTKELDFFAQQKGMITVGGLDSQRCSANWDWNPVPMLAQRWKIPLKSFDYGEHSFNGGDAFFSTFHTFIYGPREALQPILYLVKPTGPIAGKEDKDVGIECNRTNLPDLKFEFGNRQYILTPEQYVLDVVLDPHDRSKNICHLMIRPTPDDLPDIKALVGPKDWFFGQLFFNQFCVAFDYTPFGQKIGLASHL